MFDRTTLRDDRAGVGARFANDQVGFEGVTRRVDRREHRLGRESAEELAVEESRGLRVGQARRASPELFRLRGIGRVTQIVRDAECLDVGGETRRHDHEDLVAAVACGVDEGHQWVEVPGQAGRTEE